MEITVPIKTRCLSGCRNARGRNGYFNATKAVVSSTSETDVESDEQIIELRVYSRQVCDAPPVILRLRTKEWWEILSAVERVSWQTDTGVKPG